MRRGRRRRPSCSEWLCERCVRVRVRVRWWVINPVNYVLLRAGAAMLGGIRSGGASNEKRMIRNISLKCPVFRLIER